MNITLYYSEDTPNPGKQWLAHMDLGKDIYMSFFGATKEQALERANSWWNGERNKWGRSETNDPDLLTHESKTEASWSDDWSTKLTAPAIMVERVNSVDYKHPSNGSIWVIKRFVDGSNDRKRIPANELDNYLSNGYVRGGPRSK